MENNAVRELKTDKHHGFRMPERSVARTEIGLNEDVVRQISALKNEPDWMLEFRLRALKIFESKPMPNWGADLSDIDFSKIRYFLRPTDKQSRSWDDVPEEIKTTFDRLGIPEAEKKFLAGVGAQYESEVVYHSLQASLQKQGVVFCSMDQGLAEYEDIVKQYFGKLIPSTDNKFAALNSAVWSGGSFVYVPKGVEVTLPLQAYFRINAQNMGQFERTLIVAESGSNVHYVEGCLPVGEQVSLGYKWSNIEAISPDDTVMNSDGKYARVRSVRSRPYKGDIISIRPLSNENAFEVTTEHPVLAVKRNDVLVARKRRKDWLGEVNTKKLLEAEPKFIEAVELQRGDFVVFPIPQETKDDAALTEAHMCLFGYYLAEGHLHFHKILKQYVVGFSFNENEYEYIEEVKTLIFEITKKSGIVVHDRTKHGTNVIVYSKELSDLLEHHCGKGAATKVLSQIVMELPVEKQRHLLETYLNGDGSEYQRKGTMIRASTVSLALARQLQEIIARQGYYATISLRKGGSDTILGRSIVRRDQYILYFCPDRGMGEVRRQGNRFLIPIKELRRRKYEGPVFNIELERAPNAYLARGFTVHNCTAPTYATNSLHSAVVEIFVKPRARVRYTTIQNWSRNVYNLVTKRSKVEEEGRMEWIDGNLGSKVTMKYPSMYLVGRKAHGEVLSIAFAKDGQHQDAGGKVIHSAPDTTSLITSKSISAGTGRTSYRGLVAINTPAKNAKAKVQCDALLLDPASRSDTYPTMRIARSDAKLEHEATVSRVGEDQLFYLQTRGLSPSEASAAIINGFIEPIVKELPMEYAVELNRLMQLEMEGSVG